MSRLGSAQRCSSRGKWQNSCQGRKSARKKKMKIDEKFVFYTRQAELNHGKLSLVKELLKDVALYSESKLTFRFVTISKKTY